MTIVNAAQADITTPAMDAVVNVADASLVEGWWCEQRDPRRRVIRVSR